MKQLEIHLSYYEGVFNLRITNVSQAPVRIWSSGFSSGYSSIYLRVSPSHGDACSIVRKPKRWTVNIPDTVLLAPGDSHSEKLDLNDGSWDLEGCPLDPQTEIRVSAILEITADENTAKYGVMVGRFVSNELSFSSSEEIIH